MQVTYTAQELYEHIRSFDIIEFWGNQNKHNVSMIAAKTSCVTYYKGETIGHIRLEQQCGRDSDILTCCWGISGSSFTCEGIKTSGGEKFTLRSDLGDKLVTILLRNFTMHHGASIEK